MSEIYWFIYGCIGAIAAFVLGVFGSHLPGNIGAEVLQAMLWVACFSAAFGFAVAGHDYFKRKKIESEVAARAMTHLEPSTSDTGINSAR